MNKLVILLVAAFVCSATSAAPYLPYYKPFGALRSYFYSGAPVAPLTAAPVAAAPVAPVNAVPAGAVPALVGDYYTYAAASAVGLPGYSGYPYSGYPYSYPYMGAYSGYPYLKK